MEDRHPISDGREAVVLGSLLALMVAGLTNAVVAVLDAVEWAWWVAGVFLLIALILGMAWTGADQLAHAQPDNSPHESDEIEWNVRMPVSTR